MTTLSASLSSSSVSSSSTTASYSIGIQANPVSCYTLPTPIGSLQSYDLDYSADGIDGPIQSFFDQDGNLVPQFGITINGVSGVLDLSQPGVLAFNTADGTIITDDTGVQFFTSDCQYQFDFSGSSTTNVKRATELFTRRKTSVSVSKRDITDYIPFDVQLNMYDACQNPVNTAQSNFKSPQVSLQKLLSTDPDCVSKGFQGSVFDFECYFPDPEKTCENKIKAELDALLTGDFPTIVLGICGVVGWILSKLTNVAELINEAAVAASAAEVVIGGVTLAAAIETIGVTAGVMSVVCTLLGGLVAWVTANKQQIAAGNCMSKDYSNTPTLELDLTSPESFKLYDVPLPYTANLLAEFNVLLQSLSPIFYTAPGDVLQNGSFDYGTCTTTGTISPWQGYYLDLHNNVPESNRMTWIESGINSQLQCASGKIGDVCM